MNPFCYSPKAKYQRFTKSEREYIYTRDGGVCFYCHVKLNTGEDDGNRDKNRFTVDHVISRKNGGEHSLENAVACCRSCNSKKGHKNDKP